MVAKLALKALTLSGRSPLHGDLQWSLPVDGAPGAWAAVKGAVEYRKSGLHVCGCDQVAYWKQLVRRLRPGLRVRVYVVEYDGQTAIGAHGFAVRRARVLRAWDGREEV